MGGRKKRNLLSCTIEPAASSLELPARQGTVWHRNRPPHFKGSPENKRTKTEQKTQVAVEEKYTVKQQNTFSSFQLKGRKKVVNRR